MLRAVYGEDSVEVVLFLGEDICEFVGLRCPVAIAPVPPSLEDIEGFFGISCCWFEEEERRRRRKKNARLQRRMNAADAPIAVPAMAPRLICCGFWGDRGLDEMAGVLWPMVTMFDVAGTGYCA